MMKIKENKVTRQSLSTSSSIIFRAILEIAIHASMALNAAIVTCMIGVTVFITLMSDGSAMAEQQPFARWVCIGSFMILCIVGVCVTFLSSREIDHLCSRETFCLTQTVFLWALSPLITAILLSVYCGTIEDIIICLRAMILEHVQLDTFMIGAVVYLLSVGFGMIMAYYYHKLYSTSEGQESDSENHELQ